MLRLAPAQRWRYLTGPLVGEPPCGRLRPSGWHRSGCSGWRLRSAGREAKRLGTAWPVVAWWTARCRAGDRGVPP